MYPRRSHPSRGVLFVENSPTLIFLTVCTHRRQRWLSDHQVHHQLKSVWHETTDWKIGDYLLMPDHLHLFAWPGFGKLTADLWVKVWKSRFSLLHDNRSHRWQAGSFHHRIRSYESAEEKRTYMTMNPVRARLVSDPSLWPYRGEIFRGFVWW
jgi:REP-associated tyrosine transposase